MLKALNPKISSIMCDTLVGAEGEEIMIRLPSKREYVHSCEGDEIYPDSNIINTKNYWK